MDYHKCIIFASISPDAATLSFDGSQYVRVFSDQESNTQAEDITFRFRTNRPTGLLLATTSSQSSDKLELALQAGKLRLTVKLGDRDKVREMLRRMWKSEKIAAG